MKKTLSLLMSLALMLGCITGLAFNSSAEEELTYVEPSYSFATAMMNSYGNIEGLEQDPELYSHDSDEGFYFDNVWTFEYWDDESESFEPMTAYFKSGRIGSITNYSAFYTPFAEADYVDSGYTYCTIRNKGTTLHPGKASGPVITFIAPADGTISYEVGVYGGGDAGKVDSGNYATLWINDDMVYPVNNNWDDVRFDNGNSSASDPFRIKKEAFKVEAGDFVRLRISTVANSRNGKATTLAVQPIVTYHESSLPIGNPNGTPPADVAPTRVGKDTTDTAVTWSSALNAVSYNVYVKKDSDDAAVKMNESPITGTSYTITGLDFDTLYELTVTSMTADGKESAPCDPVGFKTPKGSEKTSDKTSDTSTGDTNAPATTNTNNVPGNGKKPSAEFPWWIVIVAAAVVVVVAVVLVLVLGKKKKKPAEAPAEETAPVEDVAPAEETPVEEAPVEEAPAEEKKDEE